MERIHRSSDWGDGEVTGDLMAHPYDFIEDLRGEAGDFLDLGDEDLGEGAWRGQRGRRVSEADEADQPQFDIIYQLRRILDPTGTAGTQQEANIRDGRGVEIYGTGSRAGPRVDMHYPTAAGSRVNLEVDLTRRGQQRHREDHRAAMQRGYDQWIAQGRPGRNPLGGLASVFVSARPPARPGQPGAITRAQRVEYRADRRGIVRPIVTGSVGAARGVAPQSTALTRLLTNLAPRRRIRWPRPQRFDRYDNFSADALAL